MKPFSHDLWLKIDALINSDEMEHHILQITRYYDDRYVVLCCDQDDGAKIWTRLIKLDSNGDPFFERDFGHWLF